MSGTSTVVVCVCVVRGGKEPAQHSYTLKPSLGAEESNPTSYLTNHGTGVLCLTSPYNLPSIMQDGRSSSH